jgi:hypothetical protein
MGGINHHDILSISTMEEYSGDVHDGDHHEKVTNKYANGDVYIGERMEGVRHGLGTYKWEKRRRLYWRVER